MFGIYRTVLAVLVVIDHFSGLKLISMTAVFGFFCLSGFLMTLLMDGPYKGRRGAFFTNRFLRIYPLYWLTLWLSLFYPGYWPPITFDLIRQILLLNAVGHPMFVSTSWAVTNELFFYVLIGLGISRSLRRSGSWLAFSCVGAASVCLYLELYDPKAFGALYYSFLGGSLPFSLGACAYHLSGRLKSFSPSLLTGVSLTVALTIPLTATVYYDWHREDLMILGVYASLIPHALIVMTLYRAGSVRFRKIDEMVGRFSYPIYLMQVLAFGVLTDRGMSSKLSPSTAGAVLLFSTALAGVALLFVDAPIQWLRAAIRSRRSNVPATGLARRSGLT